MSGCSEEDATDESRKKLVNHKVWAHYRKKFKARDATEAVLTQLRNSYEGNEVAVLKRIFENTSIAMEYFERESYFHVPTRGHHFLLNHQKSDSTWRTIKKMSKA